METQIENNTNPKRVQLDHLLLDVDFFSKPTILAFQFKFGDLAVLSLVKVLCAISRATNANIDPDVAYALGLSKEALDYCLEKKILVTERGLISNTRAIEDQEKLCRAQESWKKSKGRQKDSNRIPSGIHVESHRSLNTELLNTEDLNIDLRKNSQPLPPELAWIDEVLEPATSKHVQTSNLFILGGKRPMKKYPDLWISPVQLSEARDRYEKEGIPRDKLYLGFQNVAAKLTAAKAKDTQALNKIDAFSWLIGFALTDALKQYNEILKVQRNAQYQNGAEVRKPQPTISHNASAKILDQLQKQTGINLTGGKTI